MRPRVLFFIGNLGHGGTQRSLLTILDEAAAVGIDAEVAVWSPPLDHLAHVTDRGVVAHVAPDGTVAARLRWLRRLVIDLDPQIVHSLTHYTNAATSLAALGTDATAIGSVVDDPRNARQRERLLGHANATLPRRRIANSEAGSGAGSVLARMVATRTVVCAVGTDLARFHPTAPPAADVPTIVGLGRLHHVKRWDRLIDASAELTRRGVDHAVIIAGDGPEADDLRQRAAVAAVAGRVTLAGHVDDVDALLAEVSVVALTSEAEGSPNAILEAMATGRVVVATDVGDCSRLIDDGVTGWIAGEAPAALATVLQMALLDHARLVRMGRAARQRAEARFDAGRPAESLVDCYGQLDVLGDRVPS
jgi:glycosyltransferase involved in cell wall biosynthesis